MLDDTMPESELALEGFATFSPEYQAKAREELARSVACPTCDADAGKPCRGLMRGAVHAARIG